MYAAVKDADRQTDRQADRQTSPISNFKRASASLDRGSHVCYNSGHHIFLSHARNNGRKTEKSPDHRNLYNVKAVKASTTAV
jgi:hypothetical protein